MQHGKQRRWSLSAPCMFQNSCKGKIGCEYVGNDKYYKWLREFKLCGGVVVGRQEMGCVGPVQTLQKYHT